MLQKKYLFSVLALVVALGTFSSTVSADEGSNNDRGPRMGIMRMEARAMLKPSVVGRVTAVSGNTITITSRGLGRNATSTQTFTIDATNAVVVKGNATSTVSSIAVGDEVMAQGTISGSNVVATKIFDGKAMQRIGDRLDKRASSTQMMMGNGEPVVAGKVSAISGNSVTVVTASNQTYTVDATNAKVMVKGSASTLSSVAVSDRVVVQGTVNGNSIVATTVIDQGVPKVDNGNNDNNGNDHPGFIRGVGNFFKHLFGF